MQENPQAWSSISMENSRRNVPASVWNYMPFELDFKLQAKCKDVNGIKNYNSKYQFLKIKYTNILKYCLYVTD